MYPATLSEISIDLEFSCTVSRLGRADFTSSSSFSRIFAFPSSFSDGSILNPTLTRLLIFKIFSDHIRFLMETINLPPDIWRYWPYLFSRGSLWNLAVSTYSYPSLRRSSIRTDWHLVA